VGICSEDGTAVVSARSDVLVSVRHLDRREMRAAEVFRDRTGNEKQKQRRLESADAGSGSKEPKQAIHGPVYLVVGALQSGWMRLCIRFMNKKTS